MARSILYCQRYNNLIEAYRNKGRYDKAIDYYQRLLPLIKLMAKSIP
ncbi:MAG: hypothetical protein IPN13_07015 [Bacteroidetes bacterium]|nr:hypothetical protein [Bacteroidota bacterium]